jgi:hypothetical protein
MQKEPTKKQAQSAKQQSLVVDSDSDYVCEEKEMDDESGTKSAPSTMKKINSVANKTIGFVLPTVVVDGGETMTTIPNTIRENNASNVMDSVSVITQSVSRGDSQLLASRSSQASATTGLKMITYKYVQKKKKVDRKVMQEQLKILGLKDATTEEIDFHVKQSKKIRETVITLAQNRIQSVMITEAQRLQIRFKDSNVVQLRDIGEWWASLYPGVIEANAETMFKIQFAPFESGKWPKELESEYMKGVDLQYHVPPKQDMGLTGSIEQIVNQEKVNMNKTIARCCRKAGGHGRFISIRVPNRNKHVGRRKPGEYASWMLHGGTVTEGGHAPEGGLDGRQTQGGEERVSQATVPNLLRQGPVRGAFENLIPDGRTIMVMIGTGIDAVNRRFTPAEYQEYLALRDTP